MNILKKLRGKAEKPGPSLHLAAFGKHPGWDDHIPDLGVETEGLIAVKRMLYMEGIGGNIDAGAWDALEPDQRLESFHHAFAWLQDARWILGRLWSSTDGKGRSRYPMVVCAECCGMDFGATAPLVYDRLEQIEASCKTIQSAADIHSMLDKAREELRTETLSMATRDESDDAPGPLVVLARRAEMGPDAVGLVRLLYHLDRESSEFRRSRKASDGSSTTLKVGRPHYMRVPQCADRTIDALTLWEGFLHHEFIDSAPRWVICPLDREWADLLIGPLTTSQFFCMRVPPSQLPLTTDIPYQIDDDFVDGARRLFETGGEPPPTAG